MPTLGVQVDSIITDPPYGLGFMGKAWDHGVPGLPFWSSALDCTKPGGFLLAFGGTRTFHRLACAIEDAGWEIRDTIMWVYGSGFPKSLDISKAIDKRGGVSVGWFGPWFRKWREENGVTQREVAALFPSKSGNTTGCVANWELGLNMPTCEQFNAIRDRFGLPFESMQEAEREVIGRSNNGIAGGTKQHSRNEKCYGYSEEFDITVPATEVACQWQGYGTALKPAWEPIIVAMKPLDGTFAENAQRHGVAGLAIDACRVAASDGDYSHPGNDNGECRHDGKESWRFHTRQSPPCPSGRFPANLIHDGSDEVVAGFPKSNGDSPNRTPRLKPANGFGWSGPAAQDVNTSGFADMGSASRFFYCAKASRSERGKNNKHPTVKPLALMRYLCRLTKTPTGGTVLDPFSGSGSTLIAAAMECREAIGIEQDEGNCGMSIERFQERFRERQRELIPA